MNAIVIDFQSKAVVACAPKAAALEAAPSVQRLRATRSIQANAYLWGVVLATLSDYTGYTLVELHDLELDGEERGE